MGYLPRLKKNVRSAAAVLKNSLRLEDDHYDRRLDRHRGLALFQRHVELVEVETTSYCNRTCSFCPNSFLDRRSEKAVMPEACWQAIVRDLHDMNYEGTFVWSRYSEPLSEPRIVERIAEVRRAAPRARICINSNGDYLDAAYLSRLVEAGVDRLWIDIYIPDDETYGWDVAHRHHDRFLARIEEKAVVDETGHELTSRVLTERIEITTHVRNSASMKVGDMSDRGGLIQLARRTARVAPCYAPFKHLVIDWDGSVVVCCQLRSDTTNHKDAVVAKIGEDGVGLVEAYVSLADWRKSLKGYGPKLSPCATCNVSEYAATRVTEALARGFADEELPGARFTKGFARALIGKTRRI